MFDNDEKKLLKALVEKEIESFKEKEVGLVDVSPQFLKGEKKYEQFLEELINKLK